MTATERLNLILRVLMGVGIVAALTYWGIHTDDSAAPKIALGIGAPVVGFGFWGAVDFRRAGRFERTAWARSLAPVSAMPRRARPFLRR
jgi:O-antigen/teichoic acid export membrane protein